MFLNLVSDNTIMIQGQEKPESQKPHSNRQSKVIKDIGDIHEFYQNRIVQDYKTEVESLKEVILINPGMFLLYV